MSSIKKILPTDVLADSRDKINYNFNYLANESNIANSIIKKYKDELKETVETSFDIESGKIESSIKEVAESLNGEINEKISDIKQTADGIELVIR